MKIRLFHLLLSIGILASPGLIAKSNLSLLADSSAKAGLPQGSFDKVTPENFNGGLIQRLVTIKINQFRKDKGLDSLNTIEILGKAAKDQSDFMAKEEEVTTEQGGNKKTTGDRVKFYGGGETAEEMVIAQPTSKSKEEFTYDDIADQIVAKWTKGKTAALSIANASFFYIGIGATLETVSKKVYVSAVFGNFNTFNVGADKRNELGVPFTEKKYKLKKVEKPEDDKKFCKGCQKFDDMDELYKGLYVEDGKIHLKYGGDAKKFKKLEKLLKGKRDGLAVDIVFKDQYPCAPYNIYDLNRVNKGFMTKRKWSKKLFKTNILEEKKSSTTPAKGVTGKKSKKGGASPKKGKMSQLHVILGDFPKDAKGDYEINLMIIQNKRVCKVLSRKFIENGGVKSRTPLEIFPDTADRKALKYKPVAETKSLTFAIPFEKSKFNYSQKDIEPVLKQLNEPDYIINNISVIAYSSIEGDSAKNAQLEKKRAESILATINKMKKLNQGLQIQNMEIKSRDGWELFKSQIKGTKYEPLGMMQKSDAIKAINGTPLEKDMEGMLSKQRYAGVKMDILYDIQGDKEQPYVESQLKKLLEKGNGADALAIQQFMIAQSLEGKYDPEIILNMEIPQKAEFSSLINNKLWLQKFLSNDTLSNDLANAYMNLAKISGNKDALVSFNSIYSRFETTTGVDSSTVDSIQSVIEGISHPLLPKEYVDNLNIEHQFRIIDAFSDNDAQKPLVDKAIARLKSLYKIDNTQSWQNALKLAYIFTEEGDYTQAMKILDPYVNQPKIVSEDLIFLYISLTSQFPEKIHTQQTVMLLRKAKDLNVKRYCKLFGAPYLSFQTLDNPFIKEDYCKYCKYAKSLEDKSKPATKK